jgi:hypothetical protein
MQHSFVCNTEPLYVKLVPGYLPAARPHVWRVAADIQDEQSLIADNLGA